MTSVRSDWVVTLVLQHLDAAYNLGRWILGNEQDANDAVHDAFLRAQRAGDSYAGGNACAWWLAIVRNCCLGKLAQMRRDRRQIAMDQDFAYVETLLPNSSASDLEDRLGDAQLRAKLREHIQQLPLEFREALILREIEALSYREIADILQTPIGTVMSRLARGRAILKQAFANEGLTRGL
jgi:RNA polymerase sigma-70 factor, ECF subfamily